MAAAAGAQGEQELLLGHLLRVRPQAVEDSLQILHGAGTQPAEPAHITKSQLLAVTDGDQYMRVRLDRRLAGGNRELPGQTKAHEQVAWPPAIPAELDGERLALAPHRNSHAPLEFGGKLLRRTNDDAGTTHLNGSMRAQGAVPKALRNGFHFGKFRHWPVLDLESQNLKSRGRAVTLNTLRSEIREECQNTSRAPRTSLQLHRQGDDVRANGGQQFKIPEVLQDIEPRCHDDLMDFEIL